MSGKRRLCVFLFLPLMLSSGAALSEECDSSLYLSCGDETRQWFYLINGSRYNLIKVDGRLTHSSTIEETGYASCGIRYDKWTESEIEYIRVDGEINRTTGRYEPDRYTNVGCEASSSDEYFAAKRSKEQEVQLLEAERQAKDDAVKSERAF